MTVNEYKLPDVGEGLTEAEIVTWMVKVGDTIKVNDVVEAFRVDHVQRTL